MHHTCAFSLSIAQNTDLDVTAITDSILTIQNGHFLPPQDLKLWYIAAMSANLARARIITPSLRIPSTPYIRPINLGAIPVDPQRVADYRGNPLTIRMMEEFQVNCVQTGAGAERVTVIAGLGIDPKPAPIGDIISMRGTSTTAAVANAWSTIAVTWQDTIPQGQYAVVGLEHQSTNAQACRLNILNQYWRPGCVSVPTIAGFGQEMFRRGNLGEWGPFVSNYIPTVEVLCNGADASHEVYMYFVRTSGTPVVI